MRREDTPPPPAGRTPRRISAEHLDLQEKKTSRLSAGNGFKMPLDETITCVFARRISGMKFIVITRQAASSSLLPPELRESQLSSPEEQFLTDTNLSTLIYLRLPLPVPPVPPHTYTPHAKLIHLNSCNHFESGERPSPFVRRH